MHRRRLEELNLLDDFLFNKMVSHPEYGEEFIRDLLRIILEKEVGKLEVVPQKIYYGSDTDKHGARLDVYLEEAEENLENATIYDIEPESDNKEESIHILARRARFYRAKMDVGSLKSGYDYHKLKNVIVIFIMPRDPLGANRMVYTIESRCRELPEFPYDDGAKTIFLYTKGIEGNPREELKELLSYMENSCEDNARNDVLKEIHQMVKRVKSDEEVSLEYMKIYEREEMLRERGIQQGLQQGLQQGRQTEAEETARRLLRNGASYELVKASIITLTEEKLREIYKEEVEND